MNDVSPRRFARQVEIALEAGRRFVPARTIADGEGRAGDLAITFDDGLASVQNAAPVLESYGVPYTLFVVTDWAEGTGPWPAELFLDWTAIARLAGRGASIGSHSVSHPRFSALDPQSATDELVRSRSILGNRLGSAPDDFAFPLGQSNDWSADSTAAASAAGYKRIYAQTERDSRGGTVPRTFITRWDGDRVFAGALAGKFDRWEEWV